MTSELYITVQRFLKNELNEQALADFKQLLDNDENLLREVFFEKLMMTVAQQQAAKNTFEEALKEANELGDDLYTLEEWAAIEKEIADEEEVEKKWLESILQNATEEDILQNFEPMEHALVISRTKSAGTNNKDKEQSAKIICAILPQNGEFVHEKLWVKLEKVVPVKLRITIKDNKGYDKFYETIAENQTYFFIELRDRILANGDKLLPGRYTVIITANVTNPTERNKYGTVKREFLYRADLHPNYPNIDPT